MTKWNKWYDIIKLCRSRFISVPKVKNEYLELSKAFYKSINFLFIL